MAERSRQKKREAADEPAVGAVRPSRQGAGGNLILIFIPDNEKNLRGSGLHRFRTADFLV